MSSVFAVEFGFDTGKAKLVTAAREELDRLLSCEELHCPPRRRKLLKYIVEETLAGRTRDLSAVPIAQSVFGRDATFDHQTDPVVRIEAHRLRRDLASYYAGAGRNNPVLISIPKGHYVAHFECVDRTSNPDQPVKPSSANRLSGRMRLALGALAGLAIVLTVAGLAQWRLNTRDAPGTAEIGPVILVKPFRVAPGGPIDAALADGIAHEIVRILMRFPDFRVIAPSLDTVQGTDANRDANAIPYGASYVLEGSIGSAGSQVRIAARLLRAIDERVIWSDSYSRDLSGKNLFEIEAEVADKIATLLGQTYGAIRNDLGVDLDRYGPEIDSYSCVLRAFHYRRHYPGDELYGPVMDCLQKTVVETPGYAEAWALLAILHNDSIRFRRVPQTEFEVSSAKARSAASRALALDPDNVLGLTALSAIEFYGGNYDGSEQYARAALDSNPHDPDALALLGFRLIMRGKFEEGAPLMERAIARSVSPPGGYFSVLAVMYLMDGDGNAMLDAAERSTVEGSALSYALVAMAHAVLGNEVAAREALRRMEEISPRYDPIRALRRHQATDEILAAASEALRQAGWQEPVSAPSQ